MEKQGLQARQDSLDLLGLRALKGIQGQLGLLVPKATRDSRDHQALQDRLVHQDLLVKLEEKGFQDSRVKKEMMALKDLKGQLDPQVPVVHQG